MSNSKELIPVKYKGKMLTPTNRGRAYYLVTHKKAIWYKDKFGTTCIRMKVEPSDDVIDNTVLGVDAGTRFDGYTVSSNKGQFNTEVIHTDLLNNSNFIKDKSNRRRSNRRLKRGRLRHRKARFDNRTGNKETNTSVYYRQHRQNRIAYLVKIFNVGEIAIEDVKYKHYGDHSGKGKSFSPIEVGKNKLYDYIRSLGIEPQIVPSHDTFEERNAYFGIDPKLKNKSAESFYAHCLDSFILTRMVDDFDLQHTKVHFLKRRKSFERRVLTKLRALYHDKKEYYRYGKSGTVNIINHYSKLKKIRIKVNDSKSNHGPWKYIKLEPQKTFKKNVTLYGGTIIHGKSQFGHAMIGKSKYWNGNFYQYWDAEYK